MFLNNGKFIVIALALCLVAFSVAVGSASAAPVEKIDGFVCPVLGGQAGLHGMHIGVTPIAGGYFTHGGPDVSVPAQVANQGWPSVEGSFLTPSEAGYGAIWDRANAP